MVSVIGNQQYQETSLDGETFGIKPDKIFHCYKHIQGAAVISCGFSHYDEFLFGKHRQWFCRFRNEICLHKCPDCADMITKCLETDDCTHEEKETDKKEKKSFFSRFGSKRNEHKYDKSQDENNEKETIEDGLSNQEVKENNKEESEPHIPKKTFFSIFGHDVQEIENPTPEPVENVDQINTVKEDLNTTTDSKELTTQESKPKKKSFFSKFSKKDHQENEHDEKNGTKWHDDSSDDDLHEEKPKKKSSFFSRFSKKDLTKISDSEDEAKSEQYSLDTVDLESDTQEEEKEEEKEKKKTFFSKFSKSNHSKDKKSENDDAVSHDPSESNEPENIKEDKSKNKKKKKFFSRSSKKEEQQSDDEETHAGENESEIHTEETETSQENKKGKKKSFFSRFAKKDHTEEDIKTEENSLAGELEDNESPEKNNEEEKGAKNKKKSFFSKSPKKDKEEKSDLQEAVDNPDSVVENQESVENQEENNDIEKPIVKRERRKSFLAIFSKKDDESDIETDIEDPNENKDGVDTDKKKSNKKDKTKEETDKSKDEENMDKNTNTKLTRKRSFLSKSKQDLTKGHKHDEVQKKSFEDCKICFIKFKNCINNCYNCYARIEEYNWFDHCVLKHSIMMESRQHNNETVAFYLNTEFNKKMKFCFTAFNYTFFFEFIFSSGSIIINMVSNIEEDYACKYFSCHYTVSWLDTNFTDELIFTGQEFWDWNVHTIFSDKAVDEKFFDKCKLLIKITKL